MFKREKKVYLNRRMRSAAFVRMYLMGWRNKRPPRDGLRASQ